MHQTTPGAAGLSPAGYDHAAAAALYDLVSPWDAARYPSDAYYDRMVMAADAVLDVGCGTGAMLCQARERGHRGRLTGLDPDQAALDRARRCADIEWVAGTAAQARWDREFDLVTMVSHAFQCLVDDDELRASLAGVRAALRPGGRFAFETRNPGARAWESWHPANWASVVDSSGRALRVFHQVESVAGDVVSYRETIADAQGTVLRVDRARLRFLDQPGLNLFLAEAGFTVAAQYGNWDRGPVTADCPEIITVAAGS